jgi:hypothetical protein
MDSSRKITRSDSARVLRQVFHRPTFVPGHTEVAIQRFLFMDSPQAPAYSLVSHQLNIKKRFLHVELFNSIYQHLFKFHWKQKIT